MKKQVVSFLALFGLVLVLSVYYVLLPTNLFIKVDTPVNGTNNVISDVNLTIQETSNLYFSTLDDALDNKHAEIIYGYESVIASSTVSNEEKELAINSLNYQKQLIASEENMVSLILEKGYYNAYVEYLDDMIKVIVQSETLSNQQAAEIISIVLDNSICDLYPEVSYVS